MRRHAVGLILIGIGALCVAAGLTVRLVLVPQLVALPLDEDASSVSVGLATVFYPGQQVQRSDVQVRYGRDLFGDPAAPNASPDVAVWTARSALTDSAAVPLVFQVDRLCLDRHTAVAVSPCVSSRIDDTTVVHTGLSYAFPFGTQKKSYSFFDPTAKRAFPALYAGTDQIDGTQLYRFEQVVPETVIATTTVSAALVGGAPGATVSADEVYANDRTIWVEPVSGVIVKGQEKRSGYLRGPGGVRGVTTVDGTLAFDRTTIDRDLLVARQRAAQITLVNWTLPVASGLLGLVLLAAGATVLTRRPPAAVWPVARPVVRDPVVSDPTANGPVVSDPTANGPVANGKASVR